MKLEDFNIDENKIEKAITPKTKAIMPVHIFGTPANMNKINEIAKKNNLYVIEDACQAIGAKYKDKMIGTLSDIACFSFFPTKNLGIVAYYLSFGVVVGGVLQLIAHLIALKFNGISKLFFGGLVKFARGKRADTKGFFSNFFHGLVGSSAMQLSSFMDTWLASFLAAGSISYLFYANRIFQLPLAIFAIALSTALFPKITRQIKAGNEAEALKWMRKSFEILYFLLFAAAIGGIVLAQPIIKLLFERGSFTQADTAATASVLSAYMIGLLPFGLAKLFSLWLYAHLQQKLASKIAVITLVFNLVLAVILMQACGAFGLALASSLGGFLTLALNVKFFGMRKFLAIIEPKKLMLLSAVLALEAVILIFLRKFLDANF